jgi:hypothetical protein
MLNVSSLTQSESVHSSYCFVVIRPKSQQIIEMFEFGQLLFS